MQDRIEAHVVLVELRLLHAEVEREGDDADEAAEAERDGSSNLGEDEDPPVLDLY